jgi:superfamily II DNA or RNA helicase
VRPILLATVRQDTPLCEAFSDIEKVRAYEVAMRRHRAFVEPFTVTPLDARADGAFLVKGSHGTEYEVDIVDAAGERDTCTCPDFFSNELGVCKHVEAVRRALHQRTALRRDLRRLGVEPPAPAITVDARGRWPRVIAAGPWSPELRARFGGVLRPAPSEAARALLEEAKASGNVRVVRAASLALERSVARARDHRKKRALEAALTAGQLRPESLGWPLFPYQREGVLHLLRRGRALLADDMGLGKTVQAIAACELLRRRGDVRRVVVVTTATLKHQWAQEIRRWAGEQAAVVEGGARARREALSQSVAYTILNYELTWRELSVLREQPIDVLILDEAQRARNFRTKTAATLREIPSRFLFLLTGTPIENRLDDLYSLLQLVDPALLGPLWRYNVQFQEQGPTGKIIGYKNLSELRALTAPILLRRAKEEVLSDLPDLVSQTRYTGMTRDQVELEESYRGRATRLIAISEHRPLTPEEQERLMMFLLKARQACDALELCDPRSGRRASPKLDEMEQLISEIAAQGPAKILVFSEWVEMLKLAARRLEALGIGYVTLHGGIRTERRPALLDRFRTAPEVRVLLSTDAGGVGLNLQAASYVVHLDLPWNPARLDQRTGRAHRLGQTRGVMVTYLCAEQGIERGIEGVVHQKRAVREAVLDPDASIETMAAPTFSAFVREVQGVLAAAGAPEEAAVSKPEPISMEAAEEGVAVEEVAPEEIAPEEVAPEQVHSAQTVAETPAALRHASRAGDRLRLARVVLDAGFPNDAARASYEAAAAALRDVAGPGAPSDHAGLVATLYRELLPSGRVPTGAHAVLARLHDLGALEAAGVELPAELAREAISEAAALVERLTAPARPEQPATR